MKEAKILKEDHLMGPHHRFVFGATTAIITNLGLIMALYHTTNPKLNIIGSILAVALADNISDSLGIHIHEETEHLKTSEVWFSTITNFSARLLVSLIFVLVLYLLPLFPAAITIIIFGMLLLGTMSYFVAISRNRNPYHAVFEYISIAIFVIVASHLVGQWIESRF
jgi:vacuolar iron transporter family protein